VSSRIVIARPVWPVLERLGRELSARGYLVERQATWDALLSGGPDRSGVAAAFLGEYGDVGAEQGLLRAFREGDAGLRVPVVLVGGGAALRRARGFRAAGADVVLSADLPAEEILEQTQPLLTYGELYRNAVAEIRELRERAMVDELTGLPNRRHFSRELGRGLEMARRIGRPVSCIVTDIDDIRRVNERYGPPVGDSVIRQFGDMLKRAKRSYDSVARLGGDEFVWLLINADSSQAIQAAWRAHRTVAESVFNGVHEPVRVTATWGVASISPGGEWDGRSLMENADRALYWGKESGKNVVRCYPPAGEVTGG
jgi:diguanylate cyclase (GGDEF)-like protein